MAKDTIEKIRNAEISADEAEKEAGRKADRILKDASEKAKAAIAEAQAYAAERKEAQMADADQKSKDVIAEAEKEGQSEIDQLKLAAAVHSDEAVKGVLDHLKL